MSEGDHSIRFYSALEDNIDGLLQERLNSSALAMELRLFCTNLSIYSFYATTVDYAFVVVMDWELEKKPAWLKAKNNGMESYYIFLTASNKTEQMLGMRNIYIMILKYPTAHLKLDCYSFLQCMCQDW